MSNPISIDPEIMGGEPCFDGTRVPIRNLFDHIEDGAPLEDFFAGFPRVNKKQVIEVLELAQKSLLREVNENIAG
ncbi:MAG: DUF433 domain-containing protein [SAR324 cluster bacterium]|nr:DUF433 domain-containing protein [SAR324 cluster bacterium]